jgi:hypothetical protein
MNESERNRMMELVSRAISVNEQLLDHEKRFMDAVSTSADLSSLQELSDHLNELCSKELRFLAASKSLLKIMSIQSPGVNA